MDIWYSEADLHSRLGDVARRRSIGYDIVNKVLKAIAYEFKVAPFNVDVNVSTVSASSSQVLDTPAPATPELPAISAAAYAETAEHTSSQTP